MKNYYESVTLTDRWEKKICETIEELFSKKYNVAVRFEIEKGNPRPPLSFVLLGVWLIDLFDY